MLARTGALEEQNLVTARSFRRALLVELEPFPAERVRRCRAANGNAAHVALHLRIVQLPIQPGDVERTWEDVDQLIKDYDYRPNTSIKHGVKSFVDWYKGYYS